MINWKTGTAVSLLAALMSGPSFQLPKAPPPFLDPAFLSAARCVDPQAGRGGLTAFLGAAQAYAQAVPMAPGAAGGLAGDVIRYPVTTTSPKAQELFDAGLSLVVSFNHEAGVAKFREAQAADPGCTMCYWGEAYALGSNINLYPAGEAFRAGREAAIAALARLEGASDPERALIEAIAVRFPVSADGTVTEDTAAFADAMRLAAARHPEDDFILSLAAEANMNTQPWDYWEADGHTPKGRTADTISLLEAILARDPSNVHAVHLYIHATEASSDPWRALPYAEKLPGLAPQSGHLVHMPSHIHLLTGQWKRSIELNLKAAMADEAYIASGETSPIYRYGYYPHNLHFILTSAQMSGDSRTALEVAGKLDAALPGEMTKTAPWVALIKPAPYYAHAQFSAASDIIALPEPNGVDSISKAGWHYARGIAFAEIGELDKATAEIQSIEALIAADDIAALEAAFVPAQTILRISIRTVEARMAAKRGDLKTAIRLMETAADLQDGLPYSEPSLWYYPARQTLAALLLADGQLERAESMFHRTLIETPNNAYALYGLWRTYKAQGDSRSAKYAKALYKKAWMGNRKERPALNRI